MGKMKKSSSMLLVIMLAFLINFLWPQKSMAASSIARLSGDDRYETAIKISESGWQTSKDVVLASGVDFPDALCAAPLAKLLNAPILLSEKDSLDSDTMDEIKRLNPDTVFIIGGTGVISAGIEDSIKEETGAKTERLYGNNRYDTSIAVANYIEDNFTKGNEAVVVNGEGFSDALSIAPIAGEKGIPVLLTLDSQLSSSVKSFIKDQNISKTYVIGGTGVVSDNVLNALPSSERIWGADRYETNADIISRFQPELNVANIYLASGEGVADALAGSALAAEHTAPVILTSTDPAEVTRKMVSGFYLSGEGTNLYVLGGYGAIPESAVQSGVNPIVYDSNAVISYPLDGAVVDPGNIIVKWSSVPDVAFYTINAFEKGTALGWHGEVSDTSYTIGPLMAGTTYSINVTALTNSGLQYDMPPITISTKESTLNLITSPVNNAVYKSGQPIKLAYTDPFEGTPGFSYSNYNEVELKGTNEGWSFSGTPGFDITQGMALPPGEYSLDMTFHGTTGIIQSAKIEFYIEK